MPSSSEGELKLSSSSFEAPESSFGGERRLSILVLRHLLRKLSKAAESEERRLPLDDGEAILVKRDEKRRKIGACWEGTTEGDSDNGDGKMEF